MDVLPHGIERRLILVGFAILNCEGKIVAEIAGVWVAKGNVVWLGMGEIGRCMVEVKGGSLDVRNSLEMGVVHEII